jgi:hypothetical protein
MLRLLKFRRSQKRRARGGNLSLVAAISVVPLAMIVAMSSELVALSSE